MTHASQLCSANQLKFLIKQDHVNVLDSSWYLPSQNMNAQDEFQQRHIPGAQFFDIDLVSDQSSNLPHMLPSVREFSKAMSMLGISNDSHIVIYDSAGLFSAARCWWTFKVFGHANVQVLDGGLPAWLEEGGELEQRASSATKTNYIAKLDNDIVANKQAVIENLTTKKYTVLDARPKERFLGNAPEPRPGLPSGHMPESISLSSSSLITQGRLKPRAELQRLFSDAKVDSSTPIITSCGSGVTAAIITLALVESGYGLNKLYDGSWSEWGAANDTVILNRSL